MSKVAPHILRPSLARTRATAPSSPAAWRRATLVVIEFGGAWPRWLGPTDCSDVAVVAQHYETQPTSLVTQVASRMTRLEGVGWRFGQVVLVSNGRCEPDRVAARSVLARGLLARISEYGGGRFVLTLSERLGRRAQSQLEALALGLSPNAAGADVDLRVRVGEHSRLYGLSAKTPTPTLARAV
jgi:hypothetical protein